MIDDKKEEKKIGDKDNGIKSEDNVEHKFWFIFYLGLCAFADTGCLLAIKVARHPVSKTANVQALYF
ncbi:MAG: hypothetical protein US30_C0007G0007 [Candidatus Moranbacteria bacterium GW2011_GWF2_36_839]|nr:MAG: hypothetical protein US27_C0007G0043 [Candidatus Moranbacteria bacterium GW2011_GWF1_36_78]KKQ17061.1 MAG: hypothetical protein US30_C0007G0007 [Candidatus Moranbacteria bacterium GW2011_GWF2_36_839]HAT73663.1 hypothetical protein [Candidatus Moranbacteria bacterium]HBY11360.1 hypothetical protein [Candidatus Moranbacteria bacterium]